VNQEKSSRTPLDNEYVHSKLEFEIHLSTLVYNVDSSHDDRSLVMTQRPVTHIPE